MFELFMIAPTGCRRSLALPYISRSFASGSSPGEVDAVGKVRAQFLCPRNLVGGHARPEFVFVLAGQLISLLDGKVHPGIGEHVILRHAPAVGVHEPEVILGRGEPLFGGEPEPFHSFGIAFGHAPAVVIHETEVILGRGEPLFSGEPVPLHSFGIVFRHAPWQVRQF